MQIKKYITGKTDNTIIQFIRYVFVGGAATVVQYLILILLVELFGVNANVSNGFGFAGGLLTNYFISTYWVFDNSSVKNKAGEFTVFALIGIVGLGINQALIWLFDKQLAEVSILGGIIPADKYYIIGQVIATALVFFWNFFARKLLLYNNKPDKTANDKKDAVLTANKN